MQEGSAERDSDILNATTAKRGPAKSARGINAHTVSPLTLWSLNNIFPIGRKEQEPKGKGAWLTQSRGQPPRGKKEQDEKGGE